MYRSPLIFPLHVLSTFLMTGVMLFSQFVHFPLFVFADPHRFHFFYNTHYLRSVQVLAAVMLIELVTALFLFYQSKSRPWVLNFLFVLGTWVVTGFVQGPLHSELQGGYNLMVIEKFIRMNYFRTGLWMAHASIVFSQLYSFVKKNQSSLGKL